MPFCRRCGDIISTPRCNKCGGASVAPVVEWNKLSVQGINKDRWSQTYVAKTPSPSPLPKPTPPQRSSPLPKPQGATVLTSRVEEHIISVTRARPSHVKHNSLHEDTILSAPDVISSPYSSDLSKVYGSVLQPKETLESFHCHICSTSFTPDATIYPDPTDATGGRYLCRPCFSRNGGSRGNCVECSRSVLILKSEGGFVENTGRVWHKKCFHCTGCGKSIGDNPMVDLLGHPSCAECFDTCLDRRGSPRKFGKSATRESFDGLGESQPHSPGKPRKGSSTIEELEQVLGIRRRQSTLDDVHDDSSSNSVSASPSGVPQPSPPSSSLSSVSPDSPSRLPSKVALRHTSTPPRPTTKDPSKITPEAVAAAKRRFLKPTVSSLDKNLQVTPTREERPDGDTIETPTKSSMRQSDLRLLRHKDSSSSIRTDQESMLSLSSAASTPSLTSDHSDTATTASSGPSSPPSLTGENEDLTYLLCSSPPLSISRASIDTTSLNAGSSDVRSETFHIYTELPDSSTYVRSTPLTNARCAKCTLPLFDVAHGGHYVSVPEPSPTGSLPRTYHTDCFRCRICNGLFEEKEAGRAAFVRGVRGACHLHCAPAERPIFRKLTAENLHLNTQRPSETLLEASREQLPSTSSPRITSSTTHLSSRYSAPLQFTTNVSNPVPRFGTTTPCPGCSQSVSPMERGVVPGPQGQRWHSSCLVCGGKQAKGRGGRRVNGQPGCGKQLDSSAKRDTGARGVWCRDCLLLLPQELRSSQASPTRSSSPLKPKEHDSLANSAQIDRVVAQQTGVTTIARQFHGFSGLDGVLTRHVTGGRLSPTKQLGTPTKVAVQFTGASSKGTIRPRPKSAIGMRGEGRGMFLVQQLTGGGAL